MNYIFLCAESKNNMEIKERIQLLLSEMNRGVYEKEAEIGLSLLAALAGEVFYCWVLREWRSRWWHGG